MQAQFLNTREAETSTYKWFAARDRQMKNTVNKTQFTQAERIRAERIQYALELVYAGIVYEPSYGKTGISVKVVSTFVRDKKNLQALEADWEAQGIRKRVTPQGITYRMPKQ